MANTTIGLGAVLCAIGLWGYFGSASENPSMTALIPFFFGAVLVICGLIARAERYRMHAMHAAVLVSLIGFIAAAGRGLPKIATLASDGVGVDKRPVALVLSMALVCLIHVVLSIVSFIQARRRRTQSAGTPN